MCQRATPKEDNTGFFLPVPIVVYPFRYTYPCHYTPLAMLIDTGPVTARIDARRNWVPFSVTGCPPYGGWGPSVRLEVSAIPILHIGERLTI